MTCFPQSISTSIPFFPFKVASPLLVKLIPPFPIPIAVPLPVCKRTPPGFNDTPCFFGVLQFFIAGHIGSTGCFDFSGSWLLRSCSHALYRFWHFLIFLHFPIFHTHRKRLALFCFFFLCRCIIHNLLGNAMECFITCPSSGDNRTRFFIFTGKYRYIVSPTSGRPL